MASRLGVARLTARGDSKLVVMQVAGRWQVNKEHLQVLHAEAVAESGKFTQFSIEHVLRWVGIGLWGQGREGRWLCGQLFAVGLGGRAPRVVDCAVHEYGYTVYSMLGFHSFDTTACQDTGGT